MFEFLEELTEYDDSKTACSNKNSAIKKKVILLSNLCDTLLSLTSPAAAGFEYNAIDFVRFHKDN